MSEQQVYRTEVECQIGFSIQSPDGSWEKSSVSIKSVVGPGYPEKGFMAACMKKQMDDAVSACDRQIEEIAKNIVEQSRSRI